jgi:hypothetical protein
MDAPGAADCLNCGRTLAGPYCSRCGQKALETDPTLREFLHETTAELTDWDGKIPSTLATLFLKPGALTVDFLAGRRARWLTPLRLYLLCSLAFFLSKPLGEAIGNRPHDDGIARIDIMSPDGKTVRPDVLEDLDSGIVGRVFGRERLVRAALNNDQLNREIDAVLPKAMFILLPVFALLTMLACRRQLPHYPAHLYLALHLHAAWFGAFAVTSIAEALFRSAAVVGTIGAAGIVYAGVYGLLAVRNIFRESWPRTLAKGAVVTVAYGVCLIVAIIGLLAYAVTRM